MAECPKCKKEIEQLSYNSHVSVTQDFDVNPNGTTNYSAMDDFGEHINERYKCPYCYETLFISEEMATKFLRG